MSKRAHHPPQGDDEIHLRPKRRWYDFRAYFLTGLVVAAPITITIFLTATFVNFVDDRVQDLLPDRWEPWTYLPITIPGLGIVLVFISLVLLGAFTANVVGRTFLGIGETVVNQMPIIRTVYTTLKQIFETVASQNTQSFKQVVLVEYPRRGVWAIAFLTSEARGEINERLIAREGEHDTICLFLPSTPNPTTGFLLFVPREDVILLDMSVDQGAKLVISGGLVVPPRPSTKSGPTQPDGPIPPDHALDRPVQTLPAPVPGDRNDAPSGTGTDGRPQGPVDRDGDA